MTSLERVRMTLSHREPDRVPYDLSGTTVTSISPAAYRRAMSFRGLSPGYDERRVIDPISQVIIPPDPALELLEVDTRRIGAHRILHWDERLETEGPLSCVTDQYGCRWVMDSRKDFYFNPAHSPLSGSRDLKEVLAGYRMPDLGRERDRLFALLEEQIGNPGRQAWIADRCCAGLLEMSLRFRGFESFYMDLALDPESSRRLFDMIADHKIEYWDLVARYIEARGLQDSVVVVSECDDLGAQDALLVSPELLRDLVFWGAGVDTQNVLSKCTPRQVADEVKRNLDVLAPGGGFVFMPVHNVQEDVPPENFWAMWEAWEKYGAYG